MGKRGLGGASRGGECSEERAGERGHPLEEQSTGEDQLVYRLGRPWGHWNGVGVRLPTALLPGGSLTGSQIRDLTTPHSAHGEDGSALLPEITSSRETNK